MAEKEEDVLERYELFDTLIQIKIVAEASTVKYVVSEERPYESERKLIDSIINKYRDERLKGSTDDFNEYASKNGTYKSLDRRGLYFLDRYYLGYGIIQPLMVDPRIEDISCDGANEPIFVFIKEYGHIETNIQFNTEDSLNFFIRKIVQDGGKQISVSVPVVETALRDGSRVSASLGRYVTTRGPSFSIRRFREVPISPIDLMDLGSVNSTVLAYLWTIIDLGANIMVVGGTATGKTTFLNAILSFVSPDNKIVTIEDTKELNLMHENWISTVARNSRITSDSDDSGLSRIDMFDLLESALRHRPNYIVVGEVRGPETFTVFQAMLAGRFGMGTFHADDIDTFIHRLEARPISIPRTLIASLNTAVILDTYYSGGKLMRRVKEIAEILNVDPGTGELVVNMVSGRNLDNISPDAFDSHVFRVISSREGIPYEEIVKQMSLRKRILDRMDKAGIRSFDSARKVFALLKTNEKLVLEELGIQ